MEEQALINCDAKLRVATKALEDIAKVKTVGYAEARKARKIAQVALMEIEEIKIEGYRPMKEDKDAKR